MSLDFGSILSRAWKITWENKILWVFGILASLGGGGGGGNSGFNFSRQMGGGGRGPELPPPIQRFVERLQSGDPVIVAIVLGLICLGVLIWLVLLVLSVIGRGGLIGGAQLADAKGQVAFGEAWGVGLKHFWTLFLIGLVVGLIILALAVVLIGPGILIAVATLGIGTLCLIPLICVFAILAIVLGIIAYFAQIAAVIENLSLGDALRRSWGLLRSNLGSIIVLGIILLLIGGVVSFIISLPLIAVVIPPLIGLATGEEAGLRTGVIVAVVCFVVYLPVLLVANGILQTWVTSAWTLAYQQLTRAPSAPAPAAEPGALPS